jgi:Spy/CpxP family protein refolding chaperone
MAGAAHHGTHGQGTTSHLLRHLMRDKQELGLTGDQIAKLRAMALDYDRAAIRGEAEVRVAERELRALLWDERAELAAIEAKVKERGAVEAAARMVGIKAKRDLLGVLTPEQRAKEKALWEQRRHGHPGAMQRAGSADAPHSEELAVESTGEAEFSATGESPSAG